MADQLGSFTAGSTIHLMFTTHAAAGGPIAPLSAFEAADIKIYKNGSATERSSSAGITMTSPFDSIVGLHAIDIDLSDNTDSGFYAAGSEYVIVLSPDTETVDGITVLKVLAYFSIERVPKVNVTQFGGSAGTFASGRPEVNTTHLAGTSQTGRDIGASVLLSSGTGTGQISLSSGAVTAGTVSDKTGYSLSQSFPANFSSLGINASGHISRVTLADTATTLTNAPSDSSGVTTLLSRVSGNVLLAASYTAPDNSGITAIKAVTDKLDTALELDGSVYRYTTNALEQAPTGGGGGITVQDIVDGVEATYPANFGALLINGSGHVSRVTLTDTCSTNSDYTTPPTAVENADALLKRDWTAVSGEASRSMLNAMRFIRNKWSISGTTLTVYEEDGSATAWTLELTATAGADAITGQTPS